MTMPPSTPSEWLRFTADLAEKHMLTPITPAGTDLQHHLIEYLRAGADSDADPLDLIADLISILPRFHNALVQANHHGTICRRCAARFAAMLFDEIIQDASELSARQTAERKN